MKLDTSGDTSAISKTPSSTDVMIRPCASVSTPVPRSGVAKWSETAEETGLQCRSRASERAGGRASELSKEAVADGDRIRTACALSGLRLDRLAQSGEPSTEASHATTGTRVPEGQGKRLRYVGHGAYESSYYAGSATATATRMTTLIRMPLTNP